MTEGYPRLNSLPADLGSAASLELRSSAQDMFEAVLAKRVCVHFGR